MKHGQLSFRIDNLRFKRYYDGDIDIKADLYLFDEHVFSGTLVEIQNFVEEKLAKADITAPRSESV